MSDDINFIPEDEEPYEDGFEITFEFDEDFLLDPTNETDLKRLYEIMDEFAAEEDYEEAQRIKEKIENAKK